MPDTSAFSLCRFDDLPDPGSRAFEIEVDGEMHTLFVVRQGARAYAYLNSCPHTGGPLDWVAGRFLNVDNTRIQCATHDALFRIEDGLCVAGPCHGEYLVPVTLRCEGGHIRVLPQALNGLVRNARS